MSRKTAEYLYGCSADAWNHLLYREALELKSRLGKDLLVQLYWVDIHSRDFQRITDVYNAISFNDMLLKE